MTSHHPSTGVEQCHESDGSKIRVLQKREPVVPAPSRRDRFSRTSPPHLCLLPSYCPPRTGRQNLDVEEMTPKYYSDGSGKEFKNDLGKAQEGGASEGQDGRFTTEVRVRISLCGRPPPLTFFHHRRRQPFSACKPGFCSCLCHLLFSRTQVNLHKGIPVRC